MKINMHSIYAALPALAIAAVTVISASAFAMPPMEHSGAQAGGERMVRQFDQLHGKLKLKEQQEALWQRAKSASRDKMKSRHAEHKQFIEEMQQALKDPQVDLRALSARIDQRHEREAKASRETRELWLAFYDSLDAGQREIARGFLLERMAHMEKAMGDMKHERMHHGHGSHAAHDMDAPRDR